MTSYVCPQCDSDLEPCRPFNSDRQLMLGKKKSSDEFESAGQPAYICWECKCVFPQSDCYVNHRKPVGKMAAAGEHVG